MFLEGLTGWRALAAGLRCRRAFGAGLRAGGIFSALFLLGYAVLVLLLDGADAGRDPCARAALTGWAFFFGQFLVGCTGSSIPS